MSDKTSLGDRMKAYEAATGSVLVPRMPTIIRVDGKAFHTFTKRINDNIDPSHRTGPSERLHKVMLWTAHVMCQRIQNVAFAYTQSDEISFLLRDYDKLETQQWFGGKVQKIASVSAAMAATYFNHFWKVEFGEESCLDSFYDLALFDSRVFQITKEDTANYFVWRQKDATRNSIQFIARKFFSHKELHGKSNSEIQELLWSEHNVNWNDYETWKKRGACIVPNPNKFSSDSNWVEDVEIPIFSKDRPYVEQYLEPNDGWLNERGEKDDTGISAFGGLRTGEMFTITADGHKKGGEISADKNKR